MKKKTIPTQLNYLNAIINVLFLVNDNDKYKLLMNEYTEIKSKLHENYLIYREDNGCMTDKQKENMTDWKTIVKVATDLKKIITEKNIMKRKKLTSADKLLLQDYLISLLYTELPPTRVDYSPMSIMAESDYNLLDCIDTNYLVIKEDGEMYFTFSAYKTAKVYKTIHQPIESKLLLKVLHKWIIVNNSGWLLLNYKEEPLSTNSLCKQIIKIFSVCGKNISTTMLRKIYLTDKYGEINAEMNKDSLAMKHSLNSQQNFYVTH